MFVEGYEDPLPQGASWYERAINAANRIDTVHTTPWKVAMVYSLLAIAESLGASASTSPPPQQLGESPPRRPGDTDKDLLTAQDVAHMTGLSVHTLSWWRFNGGPGPNYLKLGRRIFYRRAEVEQWLARAVSDTADRLAKALRDLINEAVRAAVDDALRATVQPPSAEQRRRLITVAETRKELGGISRTTFYKLVEEHSLSMVKIGRRTFVATSELDAYVKLQRS